MFRTKTFRFFIALTVAVLSSSFNRAISQKISHTPSSATLVHQIIISTFPDFIIYHSQLEASFSIIMISPSKYSLTSQSSTIFFIVSLSIHSKIFKE
jgi:hypothetical protein